MIRWKWRPDKALGPTGPAGLTPHRRYDTVSHSLGNVKLTRDCGGREPAVVRGASPHPMSQSDPQSQAELPKNYDPTEVEGRWYGHWMEKGYFRPRDGAEPPSSS
jgi:hypothetical protein